MKEYASEAALRNALEQRLRDLAREHRVAVVRLRKAVVFERFLARIRRTSAEGWVLKGAYALDVRLGLRARRTIDVDLASRGGGEEIVEWVRRACGQELGDGFHFILRSRSDHEEGHRTIRFGILAEMAGREFEPIHVDVAVADPVAWNPDIRPSPGWMEFAGVEPVEIPVLAIEQHVAEKVHAYTRTYSSGASSRVKDLVDLALIAHSIPIDAARLRDALTETFEIRGGSRPERLPEPPDSWSVPFRQMARETGLPEDLGSAWKEVAAMIDPLLRERIVRGIWDPRHRTWANTAGI